MASLSLKDSPLIACLITMEGETSAASTGEGIGDAEIIKDLQVCQLHGGRNSSYKQNAVALALAVAVHL